MNQQSSANQVNAGHNAVQLGHVFHEQHHHATSSQNSRQHTSNRVDLTMLSVVSALVAITLTLVIVLLSPKGPVAQKLIETANMTFQDAPITSTLEITSQPPGDKRFMDGLEVEPAPPAATDPFDRRGRRK